ncbi:MAG: MFS transporter [Erysipelotrichaceae bacterium]
MLKNKNFILFFSGMFVSDIGSVLFNFATSLFLLNLTGNASFMASYLAIAMIVNLLLTPLFGNLSDRLNKVKTLYRCDFVFGITDLAFAFILFTSNDTNTILIALFLNAIINNIGYALYQPVSNSMIPMLVKGDGLQKAYSFVTTSQSAVSIFGMLLAAVLYSLIGYRWIVLCNGISYLFASFFERFIHVYYEPSKSESHFFSDLKAGFAYMIEKKELINMAKCAVIMNIFLIGITSVTLPFMINTDLLLNPIWIANFSIFFSVGSMLGAIYMSKRTYKRANPLIVRGFFVNFFVYVVICLCYFGIVNQILNEWMFGSLLCLIAIVFGFSGSYIQIPLNASYAKRIDPEYMGRVMSLRITLSSIASPLSVLAFGFLIDGFGISISLLLGTLGIFIGALYTARNKHLKTL